MLTLPARLTRAGIFIAGRKCPQLFGRQARSRNIYTNVLFSILVKLACTRRIKSEYQRHIFQFETAMQWGMRDRRDVPHFSKHFRDEDRAPARLASPNRNARRFFPRGVRAHSTRKAAGRVGLCHTAKPQNYPNSEDLAHPAELFCPANYTASPAESSRRSTHRQRISSHHRCPASLR